MVPRCQKAFVLVHFLRVQKDQRFQKGQPENWVMRSEGPLPLLGEKAGVVPLPPYLPRTLSSLCPRNRPLLGVLPLHNGLQLLASCPENLLKPHLPSEYFHLALILRIPA
ncbi:unnamed protein product [Meloidogyne enterolobii]|uniref:Uncharacterized protein n=1 Tax=Meloidogyne enterolobii TaxID=390850 RepID=A0ACB0ZK53_MELEN